MFADIRIVDRDGNDWYVAKEVAPALGYADPGRAIREHCKGAGEMPLPSPGGPQLTKIISSGDVFALVSNSQLSGVKPCKDWINRKVLVSVDKTGEYKLPEPVKETAVGSPVNTTRLITFSDQMSTLPSLIAKGSMKRRPLPPDVFSARK